MIRATKNAQPERKCGRGWGGGCLNRDWRDLKDLRIIPLPSGWASRPLKRPRARGGNDGRRCGNDGVPIVIPSEARNLITGF